MKFKTLVTHDNCADGLATAMVALDANPDLQVVFAQYNQPSLDALPVTDGMVFCDIAPPRARVREFVDAGAWVLDHHKHARDIVAEFGGNGRFADEDVDIGVSGATLAYRHLWKPRAGIEVVSKFVYLVATRDTWQTQRPEWEAAQDLHTLLMGLPRAYWLTPSGIERAMSSEMLGLGKMFRAQRAEQVGALCTRGIIQEDHGWAVFPASPALMSDAAETLRGMGHAVALGWFQVAKEGAVHTVCSLRSDGSVDVGALCKRFGGGGHSKAAGCTLSVSDPLDAVGMLMNAAREPA